MRNFKKFLTLVLAVMMVVSAMSFTTSAATTKFEDVDTDNEVLVKAVDLLEYMGIAKGVSATEFGADQAVTREQFALFMYRLMKGGKDAPATAANTTKFADLTDATYNYAISWANAKDIIRGTSDTTFSPKAGITLQDAYTMVVRALDYEEEEELIYPHGYIDVAEKEGVELDNGLPSDIDYEDTLTRGQMAIVLYNAFFAETAIPTVDTKVVQSGDEWYLKEVTTYDRLCEKHFDVKEVKYTAVATPNYAVGDNDPTYDLGYDAIFFELVTDDEETETDDVPAYTYLEPADIGVEAADLNEYFLGEFTMFVKADDEEIDRVLFADCNMVKKTVNDLKLGTVSSNKAESYYGEDTDSKLLSGKITTGAEVIYAFNAPYTYIKPTYATHASDALKYYQRNENNIVEIDFTVENDDDVDFYTVEVADIVADVVEAVGDGEFEFVVDDDYFTAQAEELLSYFAQVYYDGLYEADLYDVDGDGVYEYIDYKPYTFFQVDSDEDYDFGDSDLELDIPYVYTNEATVIGAEFVDEDYVIGYVDELTKTVKVAEVIKPTVASISRIKTNTGSIILSDGTPVNVGSAWKLVGNIAPVVPESANVIDGVVLEDSFNDAVLASAVASDLLDAERLDEEEIELYIYDGVVLHNDGIDDNLKFTENLIIPLDVNENTPEREFNKDTGDRIWYIYAWVDGECKYVPVETEDVLPEVIVDGALTPEYNKQLCTYSVDADGIYTIKSLGFDTDDEDETDKKNVEKDDETVLDGDEEEQFIVVGEEDVTMVKKAGTRFELEGSAFDRDVVLKAYTKILVLVYDEQDDKYEMVEYDATSFKASAETAFNEVTFLVSNNPDSKSKEDLVLLFAVVDGEFDLETKKDKNGQRIVSLSTPGVDENGYYRNYYELFNPLTGSKEVDIAGNDYQRTTGGLDALESGTIVELKGGMVDEKGYISDVDHEDYLGVFNTADADSLVWITEYDETDDYITVVPATVGADADCKDCFEEAVEEEDVEYFDITSDTVITVIKYADAGESTTKWGTMTLGDVSILKDAKKEYKCYSDKIADSKGNLTTKYASYLKAYLSTTEAETSDENDTVDYMIIVVNKVQNEGILLSAKDVHDDDIIA